MLVQPLILVDVEDCVIGPRVVVGCVAACALTGCNTEIRENPLTPSGTVADVRQIDRFVVAGQGVIELDGLRPVPCAEAASGLAAVRRLLRGERVYFQDDERVRSQGGRRIVGDLRLTGARWGDGYSVEYLLADRGLARARDRTSALATVERAARKARRGEWRTCRTKS